MLYPSQTASIARVHQFSGTKLLRALHVKSRLLIEMAWKGVRVFGVLSVGLTDEDACPVLSQARQRIAELILALGRTSDGRVLSDSNEPDQIRE
jgi:hypothetical protein